MSDRADTKGIDETDAAAATINIGRRVVVQLIYSSGTRDRVGTRRVLVGPSTGASNIMVVTLYDRRDVTASAARSTWEIRDKILPKVRHLAK